MKIVAVHTIINCGSYASSRHWRQTRKQIHSAVRACEWPPGSGLFTIYPQSGKKRGEGNGVKPIRDGFVASLRSQGWLIEGPAQNALGLRLETSTVTKASFELLREWLCFRAGLRHEPKLRDAKCSGGRYSRLEHFFDFEPSLLCRE